MNKAIVINKLDNVATSITSIEAGSLVTVKDGSVKRVKVSQSIPYGHKFALIRIKKGESVIKYGAVIGRTTKEIREGEHVHIHNVESMRGWGDFE
jgi:altronate dehydratase small subunit